MLSNDIQIDPIVRCARAAKKLCKITNASCPIKSLFSHSLLRVTKFSMLSTCAQFSADQNRGLHEQIALTLVEMCLFLSLCKIGHNVVWGKEG